MLKLGINTKAAVKQLNLLALDPNKRRRIMRGAGRTVRRHTRARLRSQKDLSDKTWQDRADGRKQRMMRKLGKQLYVNPTPNEVVVSFKNRAAKIARAQQDGITLKVTAEEAKRKSKNSYSDPATRKQAKALRNAGYKIRRKRGKGWKAPSLKWITANISSGQAGLILKILRKENKEKKSWEIKLPSRSFLGQSQSEKKKLDNYMLDEAIRL